LINVTQNGFGIIGGGEVSAGPKSFQMTVGDDVTNSGFVLSSYGSLLPSGWSNFNIGYLGSFGDDWLRLSSIEDNPTVPAYPSIRVEIPAIGVDSVITDSVSGYEFGGTVVGIKALLLAETGNTLEVILTPIAL